jgi:branched-chain amino acid transport system permease protein
MRLKLSIEVLGLLALAVLIAVMPRLVSSFTAYEMATVGMYFIALLGLSILTGYSGQISLGHGAFMAIGGYTTAVLTVNGVYGHHIRDLWTIPIAGVIAGAAGLLVGIPALRLSGLYLALITFGIAVSFRAIPLKFDHFLGGTSGKTLNLVQAPFGLSAAPNDWIFYLTWGIAFVLLVAAWIFVRGKAGRTLKAIRDSEIAATSSGISLARYKTLAFALSAFYAGVGGSLYAIARAYMNPDVFPVVLSVYLVAALALGGVDSFVGLILGASAIYILINRTSDVTGWINHLPGVSLNSQRPGMPDVIFGAVLIVVLILMPNGVGGALRRLFGPLTTRLYSKS